MKTSTLQHLMVVFQGTRSYHMTSALLETDPERQSRARRRTLRVSAIMDAIQFELSEREAHPDRPSSEVKRVNDYLERLLEEFLDLGKPDTELYLHTFATDPTDGNAHLDARPVTAHRRGAGRG